MVITTSASLTALSTSSFGFSGEMLMFFSAMAATATGLTWSAGSLPPESTSTASPAIAFRNPAAIWLRPALWTHTKRTVGRLSLGRRFSLLMRNDGAFGYLVDSGIERLDGGDGNPGADGLSQYEGQDGSGGDAREGVRELTGDRDSRVRKAGRGGEPIGRGDICAHRERREPASPGPDHAEDDEQQSEGGHRLAEPEAGAEARPGRKFQDRPTEHEVGGDSASNRSRQLSHDVAACSAGVDASNDPIG